MGSTGTRQAGVQVNRTRAISGSPGKCHSREWKDARRLPREHGLVTRAPVVPGNRPAVPPGKADVQSCKDIQERTPICNFIAGTCEETEAVHDAVHSRDVVLDGHRGLRILRLPDIWAGRRIGEMLSLGREKE